MDPLRSRLYALLSLARRRERRELRDFRQWLEHTSNLLHLSVLVFVPLSIGIITYVFNREDVLPFLLFPPLASGTYTLFAEPEGRYANPWKFVAGMTAGASCGWIALVLTSTLYEAPAGPYTAHAGAAAFGVFLTGAVTWAFDIEEPTAFSTALLVLVVGSSQFEYLVSVAISSTLVAVAFSFWRQRFYEQRGEYLYQSTKGDDHVLVPMRGKHPLETAILGARLAAAHDAGKVVLLDVVNDNEIAIVERDLIDENALEATGDLTADGGERNGVSRTSADERSESSGSDHERSECDPRRDAKRSDGGEQAGGPRVTSAEHGEARPEGAPRNNERRSREHGEFEGGRTRTSTEHCRPTDGGGDDTDGTVDAATDEEEISNALARDQEGDPSLRERAEDHVATGVAEGLEGCAARIEREIGVPCEVVITTGDDGASPVLETARAEKCDLIVGPYETDDGNVSAFVDGLFKSDLDTLVHRSETGRTEWNRIMVPVRGASAVSHTMIDFAERLSGHECDVSVCHCVNENGDRRAAERMLSDLVETCRGDIETRVSRSGIETFLETCASEYDLIVVGASTDRTAASRLLSPPTFERLDDLECDVAIVHG